MKTNLFFSDTDDLKQLKLLLIRIWTQPTVTLRFVLSHCPNRYVTVLLALGGVARVVDRVAHQHDGDYLALIKASPLAVVMGALSGWLTYYVYGWSLSAVGRWLGGAADSQKTRTVLAWALVPVIAALGLVLLYVSLFNNDLFTVPASIVPALRQYSGNVVLIVQGLCTAWALVILSKGLQLIQGFGPGRALVNILLPGTILIAGILLISRLLSF